MRCLFCDFVSGKRKEHTNKFPLRFLRKTRHSVSFLATDFPANEDGHTIVIPKKHYKNFEDIPANEVSDLIKHVQLVAKSIRGLHKGCNILLNDGKSAGQMIMHTHFHVIPRDPRDGIKIEVWKRKKISKHEFIEIHDKLSKEIKKNI